MEARSLICVALSLAGCSWSRFDELEETAPVVLLEEPSGMGSGFGSAVAALSSADDAHVVVAAGRGQHGAAQYRIGFGQNPVVDALDSGQCRNDCTLANSVAGLANAATPGGPRSFCWATGSSPLGIALHCEDAEPLPDHALAIPPASQILPTERLVLASDRDDAPALAAATTSNGGSAWFHPPLDASVVPLVPAAVEPGFGASIAVVRVASGRIYAVGAPDAGRVLLFAASADDKSVASTGCISGGPGFGRTLAAGDVDGAAGDELLVSAAESVEVLGDVPALAQGGACAAAVPLVSLACVTTGSVSGCGPGSGFGDALAVGDLNGDGNGEVIVGAPGMSVRGESRAGAALVFDVDLGGAKQPHWLSETKFISSAESGDALGSSLATVLQRPPGESPRHVLLAGAPGGDKAAMFYCFELPSGKRGTRCK